MVFSHTEANEHGVFSELAQEITAMEVFFRRVTLESPLDGIRVIY